MDFLQLRIVLGELSQSLFVRLDLVLSLVHPLKVAILCERLLNVVQLSLNFLVSSNFLLIFLLLFG